MRVRRRVMLWEGGEGKGGKEAVEERRRKGGSGRERERERERKREGATGRE